jgi:hypothetical protein
MPYSLPSWYNANAQVPFYSYNNPDVNVMNLMNWYLPQMSGVNQAQMAQWLYSQRGADEGGQFEDFYKNYNVSAPSAGSIQDWMTNIGNIANRGMPTGFQDPSGPEQNWLNQISGSAGAITPGMTREAQRTWRNDYENWIGNAPNKSMASLGAALYNPTVQRTAYGSSTPMGTYLSPASVKAGLVSNPYYVG